MSLRFYLTVLLFILNNLLFVVKHAVDCSKHAVGWKNYAVDFPLPRGEGKPSPAKYDEYKCLEPVKPVNGKITTFLFH